ncbi:TetR/AcrR family transcriptional regulator [Agromyces subbeticus]|uniref:TetR/AcrR family transcriptional regulator n=1 Tax=Agromyces subbeticus TaxID=293890 RepID=UPI0003B662DB|nr:TetR/AcrR family transcriptional regulator [Agromyces subbeticus]
MSTRDRILDAAARVMTERGIAATTTRAIAAAASCSEALLYKHFADKQQIFLAVLLERMPGVGAADDRATGVPVAGAAEVTTDAERLTELTRRLFDFFVRSFPISVSIFGSPELLAEHRDAIRAHGYGPEGAIALAAGQLRRDQRSGAFAGGGDLEAVASVLVGFAFHQAFLATFDGRDSLPAEAVQRAVATVLPALEAGDRA